MAVGDNKQYVIVTAVDAVSNKANNVRLNVGDSIDGMDPVAIIGGNFKQSDPWVLELKSKIASRRVF